jgi:hypothetical protein
LKLRSGLANIETIGATLRWMPFNHLGQAVARQLISNELIQIAAALKI